jgi:hypothetical protein
MLIFLSQAVPADNGAGNEDRGSFHYISGRQLDNKVDYTFFEKPGEPFQSSKLGLYSQQENFFYLYFRPDKKIYFYLLMVDPVGKISRIYPEEYKVFTDSRYGKDYFFPESGQFWDNLTTCKGTYRLLLLISTRRQEELENLITRCRKLEKRAIDSEYWLCNDRLQKTIDTLPLESVMDNNVLELPDNIQGTTYDQQQSPRNTRRESLILYPETGPETALTEASIKDTMKKNAGLFQLTNTYIREWEFEIH